MTLSAHAELRFVYNEQSAYDVLIPIQLNRNDKFPPLAWEELFAGDSRVTLIVLTLLTATENERLEEPHAFNVELPQITFQLKELLVVMLMLRLLFWLPAALKFLVMFETQLPV